MRFAHLSRRSLVPRRGDRAAGPFRAGTNDPAPRGQDGRVRVRRPCAGCDLQADGKETVAETVGGRVCSRARRCSPQADGSRRSPPPLRRRLTLTSSHMVITEPVPDVLADLGWTGGECITDSRHLLHYFRTTPDGAGRLRLGRGTGASRRATRGDGASSIRGVVAESNDSCGASSGG